MSKPAFKNYELRRHSAMEIDPKSSPTDATHSDANVTHHHRRHSHTEEIVDQLTLSEKITEQFKETFSSASDFLKEITRPGILLRSEYKKHRAESQSVEQSENPGEV